MNNNLVSLNLNSTKNSALQKNSTVSSNIVNLNLLDVAYTKGTKSNFQADLNNLELMEEEYTFEELMEYAEKQLENMKAASHVETAINNIGDIDPNDLDDIQRALSIYNSLTEEQKRCVSSDVKAKLENAIKDYDEAVSKASSVIEAIKDIGTIDLNSKDEIDKAWALYNSLTEEQKAFLSPEVSEYLKEAEEAYKKLYDREVKTKELENLYKEREDNNGIFHPIKEAEIEDKIKKLEKELGVPHQPDGWEKFCETGATVCLSFAEGVLDVGEAIIDGGAMLVGGATSYIVGLVDEDAGNAMQSGIQSFVQTDLTGIAYDAAVDALDITEEIAYGTVHDIAKAGGSMFGYAALSLIPGGAVVTGAAGALAAAGGAAEQAFNSGATFDEAFTVSVVAGGAGALAGAGADKLHTLAKGSTSLLQAGGYTLAGMGVGAIEPIVNSGTEYFVYGKDMVDANGNLMYENAWDYYVNAGGLLNTGIGMGAGGLSTGFSAIKGYNTNKYKAEFNANMNSMMDSQKSQSWEDYYKQRYGADAVEHTSGIDVEGPNGSYVDPDAARYNEFNEIYLFGEHSSGANVEGHNGVFVDPDAVRHNEFNANMNSMMDSQKSQSWEEYYKQQYGVDAVEHTSGIDVEGHNGSYVDPDAASYNIEIDGKNAANLSKMQSEIVGMSRQQLLDYYNDNKMWANPSAKAQFKQLLSPQDYAWVINGGREISPKVSAKYINSDGSPSWPGNNGYEYGTRTDGVLKKGTQLDRYGGEGGRFVGVYENGKAATFEERALPWDPSTIGKPNTYKVIDDISTTTLNDTYRTVLFPEEQVEVLKYLNSNFDEKTIKNYISIDKKTLDKLLKSGAAAEDIVKMAGPVNLQVGIGKIAPYFNQTGGGLQSDFPVSISMLKEWGFLE